MFELKRLSHGARFRRRWRRRSATACSTSPARRRASASTCCGSIPAHQDALVTLVLALTDQFPTGSIGRADGRRRGGRRAAPRRLQAPVPLGHHPRAPRQGRAATRSPGSARSVHEWLREAMSCYEAAEAIRPAGNDEAILRWNTCARILTDLPAAEPDIPEFHGVQSE